MVVGNPDESTSNTGVCIQADYNNPTHAEHIVYLLNEYAQCDMGGRKALSEHVQSNLIDELKRRTFAITLIYYVDDLPVGLLNAFEGFSTFAAAPLINIHDVFVLEGYRRQGIVDALFNKLERFAQERNCCKLTLEVLRENTIAQHAYKRIGFSAYSLAGDTGVAEFWQKTI